MPKSFVHLHLHTEYSMLDGASRIGDVVGAAVADGQPAVGITDHGNMYGVLALYRRGARRGHHAGARHGGATSRTTSRFDRPKRSEHEIYHLTLLAEIERRLPQPHPGEQRRVHRRLLLQAPHRLGAVRAPPRGPHRDDRLPRRSRLAADPRRARARGARSRGAVPGHLRARPLLRRGAGPRPRRRRAGEQAAARHRARDRRAAARHERQSLHAHARRRGARRVALRADRRAA